MIVALMSAPIGRAEDAPPRDPEGEAFFEQQIRPLLARRCYQCHSEQGKGIKGGLRLDHRAGWAEGGDSGPAIEPGKPDDSLLIQAVRYESLEMPPEGRLPAAEIELLVEWVRRGAPDPRVESGTAVAKHPDAEASIERAREEHWAFRPPVRHAPPETRDNSWSLDEWDRFVLARIEAAGLAPAPDAEPATWLRRVTYDLTGLPPTLAEQEAFLASPDAAAREAVVDRLLASPEFGVQWGRHWLDVARYADSNGGDFNATFFSAWRYRDYVVDAFNQDLPFDRFLREQLAGDLLPAADDAERSRQLIASSFLMLGAKMLSERDKAKLTMDVVDEQIDAVGGALLGLTLSCARCHDHKFDPVPARDYYALAGILSSTVTLEGESQQYVSDWIETPLPMPPELAAAVQEHAARQAAAEAEVKRAKEGQNAAEERLASLRDEQTIVVDDPAAEKVGDWKESKFTPPFVGAGYLHDDRAGKGEKSVSWTPELPREGMYEVRISYSPGSGRDARVPVVIRHADGETKVELDQTRKPPLRGGFLSLGKFRFAAGRQGSVTLSNAGTTQHVIADAVQFAALDAPESQPDETALAAAKEARAAAEAQLAEAKQQVAGAEQQLQDCVAAAPEIPRAMAPREAPTIADCELRIRGEHSRKGERVPRGFLRVVDDGAIHVSTPTESGRRELAEWIARPEHPLTSRVLVNRVWQRMFGEGLVRTVDNFGLQGEPPTHPELLDEVALWFTAEGWSLKSLVRRIALSRTYGLATYHDPQVAETDPENRLLSHAHRKRLSAEELRDSMLAFSGRLDHSPGGSPVAGFGRLVVDNSKQESQAEKEESLRRTIYLPVLRNEVPAQLTLFDFPDPDVVNGRRPETNVPAQALFLLNHPFVERRMREGATRLLAADEGDEAVLDRACRELLGRLPTPAERERLLAFVAESGAGDPSRRVDAWTALLRALVASTEFRLLD